MIALKGKYKCSDVWWNDSQIHICP